MKSLRLLIVGLLLSTTSVFSVSAQAAEPSVTVSGITLSWPAVIYRPVSSSQVTMSIANNSGRTLLYVAYTVTDRIGTQVAFGSATEIPRGLSSITHVAYFPSAGIPNPPSVSAEFDFASRSAGGASPTAAPTVAKTATPSSAPTVYITNPSDKNLNDLVTSLKSQVNLLNAKLKKICAVKPKPKNC
jgi:hypothetical protein